MIHNPEKKRTLELMIKEYTSSEQKVESEIINLQTYLHDLRRKRLILQECFNKVICD